MQDKDNGPVGRESNTTPRAAIPMGELAHELLDATITGIHRGEYTAPDGTDLDQFATRMREAWLDGQTEYRLSPAGVLAKRDMRREPGWTDPHFVVIDVPAGDRSHHLGQHLTDAAVADWSRLVRARVVEAVR